MGMETAAASRVAVMIQEAFAADVAKIQGSSLIRGMMSVWARETSTPPPASAATARLGEIARSDTHTANACRRLATSDWEHSPSGV